jgi:hypothetical protein
MEPRRREEREGEDEEAIANPKSIFKSSLPLLFLRVLRV